MMKYVFALVMVASAILPCAAAADETRHSGRITEIAGDRITIEEMGPWTGSGGLEKRSIDIGQATTVRLAERADDTGPAGWPGGFREMRLSPSDLRVGDYVTVTTATRGDGRLMSAAIEVVRPEETASASPR